jgi:hypothetical protein
LPSASSLTLGKEQTNFLKKFLCLAPPAWRSAKSKLIFLKKNSLPSASSLALGKEQTNFFFKKKSLPSASSLALGKGLPLPRAKPEALGKAG